MGVIAYCLSMRVVKEADDRASIIADEESARRRMMAFFTLKLMIKEEEELAQLSPIAMVPTRSILRSRQSSPCLPSPEAAAKKVSFSCAKDLDSDSFTLLPPVFCDVKTFVIDDNDEETEDTTIDDEDLSFSPQSLSPRSPRSINQPAYSTLAYIKQLRMGMKL
eukprot:TRINITY_DN6263_c0_g1_i1.p1 TRINITY_DN6263_c0_g1~~TRINITY_DN6263_c0_g1_i1.p1  ORF type:complete len:164 (+),score=39.30 TRINITY_DN6263_c0_g1_i1:96-587(+)